MLTFLDREIAHITRVMPPSLQGDLGGPILPSGYWRFRLCQLFESDHVTTDQLCSVDDLLLQLDQFDADQHAKQDGPWRRR